MKKKLKLSKSVIALLVLFIIINTACLLYSEGYIQISFFININVVVVANLLLFIIALFGVYQHTKVASNPNPNAFVRSIMLMTIIKIFVLCGAAFIYMYVSKQNRNIPGVIIGMVLYILYSIVEVSGAYKLNKSSRK